MFPKLKYFNAYEFDSPDRVGSGRNMSQRFLRQLDLARSISGVPYHITSGYRTITHNAKVKGTSDSSHLKGLAVDIYAGSSRIRFKIIYGLLKAGFRRIGIGRDFIHVDGDGQKDQKVFWLYD